jgi:very-short-patch-repair endonuclease
MKTAVLSGRLDRVRRSWLVTPDCDARRRHAASVSGRVTCITAASIVGWWHIETDATHVALPRSASRFDATSLHVHRALGPVPVHPRATIDPPLAILFQVARCRPPLEARAVWESAVRKGAVDVDVLARVRWRSDAAKRIASQIVGRSDSGPETVFISRMRRIGVTARQQVWIDGHPIDALIGDRLAVQIDGFAHHSSARDRRRDLAADARLVLRGYTVLRFDYHQVMFDTDHVEKTVLSAMAQGLHRRTP